MPCLEHGLQHVLKGDGIYPLTAPWMSGKSMLYKYLRKIIQPEFIAWHRMPKYIPAKDDVTSHRIAEGLRGVEYTSSTSSLTPTLSTLYHLVSNFRETELIGGLSPNLGELPTDFAKTQRKPTAFLLTPIDSPGQIFSINAHEGIQSGPRILLELGNSIERMLTMPAREFLDKFVLSEGVVGAEDRPSQDAQGDDDPAQFYHYSLASKFLMRAQIDCRNPDNGEVFDVKTRAVAPIRYNLENYKSFITRKLRSLRGVSDSYEREFYDMVRSVFIKYALQLRIGRMSGALIAYHNTAELLGLEYVALREIEAYVFGGSKWADIAFATSVRLLERVLNRIREAMFSQNQTDPVKVLLSTERSRGRLKIYAQRLVRGKTDPLGPDVFAAVDENWSASGGAPGNSLLCTDMWHVDAYLHGSDTPGVAIVGASPAIGKNGGEQVSPASPQNRPRRRRSPNSPVHDIKNHDTSTLVPGEFYVWHLEVAPIVKGKLAPKGGISVDHTDDFELRYSLVQVKEVTDFMKSEYITDLARLYVP